MLEPLGLDDATERAYRRLVGAPQLTAAELARQQSCGPDAARRMLDELIAAGLAIPTAGRPTRYSAVDPRVGLAALIRTRRLELERTTRALEVYSAEYHERQLRSDTKGLVEVIEGPTEITARLAELMEGAEREVVALDTPPYVTPDTSASDSERRLLARGIRVRAMYASEVLAIPERADRLRDLVALGEEARVVPRVPLKMVLVDGRNAVIPLTASEEGTRTTAALVRPSRLCDALRELFEAHWAQATPVFAGPAAEAGPHPDLTEADLALLHLLNAGLKDEAIYRQLGVSERTARRRITDLLDRLGTTSRFQAGAQAVRRGWL